MAWAWADTPTTANQSKPVGQAGLWKFGRAVKFFLWDREHEDLDMSGTSEVHPVLSKENLPKREIHTRMSKAKR